jgi:hypothetical protein
MRFIVFAVPLVLLIPDMGAHAGDFDLNYDPGPITGIEGLARRIDPKGDAQLSPTLKGGFRTTLGAQFAPSCMQMLGKPNDFSRNALNDMVSEAAKQMVGCRRRYPELTPYIEQWMTQARRNVIECVEDSKENETVGGWNDTRGTTTLPRKDLLRAISEVTIVDVDWGMTFRSQGMNTFVHENLHSTTANNRLDHSAVEFTQTQTGADSKTNLVEPGGCKDDVLVDRVNILTSLCTGENIAGSDLTAFKLLHSRITGCGMKRACHEVFASSIQDSPWPSEGLPPKQVESLCNRLYEDGQCMHLLESQGDALIGGDPEVQRVARKLHARLRELAPSHSNEIPSSWMKLFPELKIRLDALESGSSCFRALFLTTPSGTVYLRDDSPIRYDDPVKHFRDPAGSSLDGHVRYKIFGAVQDRAKHARLCNSPEDQEKVLGWVLDLEGRLRESVDPFLWMRPVNFALGEYQKGILDSRSMTSNPSFKKLIGQEFWERFAAISRKYDSSSAEFSCEALGLSLRRTVERALIGLNRANQPLEQNSCSLGK